MSNTESKKSKEVSIFSEKLALLPDQDLIVVDGFFAVKYIKRAGKDYKLKLHLPKDVECNIDLLDEEITVLPNPNSQFNNSIIYINSLNKTKSIRFDNYILEPKQVLTPEGNGLIIKLNSDHPFDIRPINPDSSYEEINAELQRPNVNL